MVASANERVLADLVKHLKNSEEDVLTPLIDEYLIKRNLPKYRKKRLTEIKLDLRDRPRPGGRLSPSSICGCKRQAALKFLGTEGQRKINPEQELIFDDGHWRHHKWGVIFLDMERVLGRDRFRVVRIERPIVIDGLMVAGHLDVEIKIKVGKKWRRYIVDFKGANNYMFEKSYREHAPDPTYIRQLMTYMKARKCKRGILLYDSKDKNKFYAFHIAWDEKLWAEVQLWCEDIIEHLEEEKLPPMHEDCDKGKFMYGKCPFKGICFGPDSDRQIRRKVYENFPGVEELWALGHAVIEEHGD